MQNDACGMQRLLVVRLHGRRGLPKGSGDMRFRVAAVGSVVALAVIAGGVALSGQGPDDSQGASGFRFRTGVALINVTATVTDSSGRFVRGLRQEDFVVYEDDVPQTITHFSADRVPVSLGIVLDTSGSMAGERFAHAQRALDRFLYDLLDSADEVFLARFSSDVAIEQGWTTDRAQLSRALRRVVPRGGTAMYDAIAESVPVAEQGANRKKALLVISDGNDNTSQTRISDLKQMIRESEVMVYAIGIEGSPQMTRRTSPMPPRRPPAQPPFPFPIPGRRTPWPPPPIGGGSGGGNTGVWTRSDDRVNVAALRSITDDTGGRTEIIRSSRDLEPSTASIADELSQQYFLAYPAAANKDGRWHSIRVEVKDARYRVRARNGYIAN
jgi:VWFA-related protein